MNKLKPRLMVVGAHPDDAEFNAAGLMLRYAQAGCAIAMVSLTDGSAGHQTMGRADLRARRAAEAAASAKLLGAELNIWSEPDGALQANLRTRERLIHEIRVFAPDLIVTHRANDYHPDHRAAAQLVQDACYLVRVPNVVPEIPALVHDVVVAHVCDFFQQPQPFVADLVLPLDAYFDKAYELLACHISQVQEWLPFMQGEPGGPSWLAGAYQARAGKIAKLHANGSCQYAEALQLSEYGQRVTPATLAELALLEPTAI